MLRAIFWKEWRQQRLFLLAIFVFLPILIALLLWLSGTLADERHSIWDKLGIAALSVAVLQAMVTGSLLFAGEVETGTIDFLDACSAERSRIWLAKMASALLIALPAALLPMLCGGLEALPLTVFAIETLLVTAACSVFVRTTFRALGAAVLALCILVCVVVELAGVSALGTYGLSALLVCVAVFAAWLRFCRADRERHGDRTRPLLMRLPLTWLTGPLWFLVCRQWMTLASLGLVLVAFYIWVTYFQEGTYSPFSSYQAVAVAPAFLFAVGCVLGWSVFAVEQAGAERFLGDQRFPRNRLWLAKVGSWLALTTLAILYVAFLCSRQMNVYDDSASSALGREFVFGLLGFSAGQFFGIHDRRLPVAIFLTLLAAAPIGAAWYAPLFSGAPVWHFAAVPILLLTATRFELRGWTAGRLEGAAHWLRCGLVAFACWGWTGLLLWQRTAEVPDIGEPFVATESATESPLEHERNLSITKPAFEARKAFRELRLGSDQGYASSPLDFARWHEPGIELGRDPLADLPALYDQVLVLGAPDDKRDEFARLMNEASAGDWATALRNAIADGPRRIPILGTPKEGQFSYAIGDAARILFLKSALSVAEGKTDAALDDFALSLAIVRHRYLYGSTYYLGAFEGVEDEMLEAAETLLRRGGSDPALCRGLLALLNRHAQEMPSFADLIKASYSMIRELPMPTYRSRYIFAGPTVVLLDAFPEMTRDDRLQRAFCRGLLNAAEQKTLFLRPLSPEERTDRGRLWPVRYMALATPDRSADDWTRILSHQTLNEDVPLFQLFHREFHRQARTVARRNAIRLACAAALYRHDHGRDPGALAELAPEYFPALPESPYSECDFVYRRSPGETWKLVHNDDETSILRTIAPGTGVVEMPCLPTLRIAVPTIR